jgi:hypothetical protein
MTSYLSVMENEASRMLAMCLAPLFPPPPPSLCAHTIISSCGCWPCVNRVRFPVAQAGARGARAGGEGRRRRVPPSSTRRRCSLRTARPGMQKKC